MNFRFIKGLGIIAIASMTIGFAACGDDDDDPEPNPIVNPDGNGSGNDGQANGTITSINGTHLTGVGPYRFKYDTEGRVASVYYGNDPAITFDYASGKLCFYDTYDDEDDIEVQDVRFTKEGYLAGFSGSWDEIDDDGYRYVGSGYCSFSYNSDGNLVEAVYESNDKEIGPDGTFTEYDKHTCTFTWTDGNLVKMVEDAYEKDEDGVDTWTNTFTLTYGDTTNAFKQYSLGMGYLDFGEGTEALMCAGLFGKGPAKLPNKLSRHDYDGYSYDADMSFELNDNGTIAKEYFGEYYTLDYFYQSIDSRGAFGSKFEAKKFSLRNFFKSSRPTRK